MRKKGKTGAIEREGMNINEKDRVGVRQEVKNICLLSLLQT